MTLSHILIAKPAANGMYRMFPSTTSLTCYPFLYAMLLSCAGPLCMTGYTASCVAFVLPVLLNLNRSYGVRPPFV